MGLKKGRNPARCLLLLHGTAGTRLMKKTGQLDAARAIGPYHACVPFFESITPALLLLKVSRLRSIC